jgi:predicted nucleotidyltransferase
MSAPTGITRLNEVLQQLRRLPYADRILVFGSVAAGKARPFDIDIALIEPRTRFERGEQLDSYGALLRLARRYYGDLDPFLAFPNLLICRNAEATAWVRATHARGLRRAIQTEGRPLAQIPSLAEP